MIKTDIVEKLTTSPLAKKWTTLPFIVEAQFNDNIIKLWLRR
jgi:hypothetical protein